MYFFCRIIISILYLTTINWWNEYFNYEKSASGNRSNHLFNRYHHWFIFATWEQRIWRISLLFSYNAFHFEKKIILIQSRLEPFSSIVPENHKRTVLIWSVEPFRTMNDLLRFAMEFFDRSRQSKRGEKDSRIKHLVLIIRRIISF